MPWPRCTLDNVRAVIRQARMDTAMDADGEGQTQEFYDLFHVTIASGIRARIADGNHALDADPLSVPPEFVLLVALQIAAMVLSRPGVDGGETSGVFTLTNEQRDMIKRLETRLDQVSEGKRITATDNPEVTSTTGPVEAPSVSLVRPGIGNTQSFTNLGTSG